MYKKDVAEKVGWYSKEFEYSQDFDLTIKFLKKSKIALMNENLVSIRRSPDSMSEKKFLGIIREEENLILLKKIRDSFKLNANQQTNNNGGRKSYFNQNGKLVLESQAANTLFSLDPNAFMNHIEAFENRSGNESDPRRGNNPNQNAINN